MPWLFSYGTLRQPSVQRAIFGRLLRGDPDELVGFERVMFRVEDDSSAAARGATNHAIVRFTGDPGSRVPGMALELTDAELAQADAYEPAGYTRVSTILASGRSAWVYADARYS